MLHLHTERLAALGDELPTPEEEAHLAACEVCAHERNAYRALVAMAHAEREPFGLPLTRWDAIAAELALPAPQAAVTTARAARRQNTWMMQAAAGLLLVAGGAMAGRISAGAGLLPQVASVSAVSTPARNVSQGEGPRIDDSVSFASVDEARAAQLRYEQAYQQAAAYLAQYDTPAGFSGGSQVAYRSRLAALDRVLTTTSQAIREAPHDPVLNGYYLTTLGQREATLRQLNTALPASIRVNSF